MANFGFYIDLEAMEKKTKDFNLTMDMFSQAMDDAFEEIGTMIYKRLLENLSLYGLGGSTLSSTAMIERYHDGFAVSVSSEYAFFVEFGTGIVGQESPHPNTSFVGTWTYDSNGHGNKGWFYPTTESDPNPYKHYFQGVLYGFTKGMPSRPFMYKTWLYGTRIVNSVIMKHMRRVAK